MGQANFLWEIERKEVRITRCGDISKRDGVCITLWIIVTVIGVHDGCKLQPIGTTESEDHKRCHRRLRRFIQRLRSEMGDRFAKKQRNAAPFGPKNLPFLFEKTVFVTCPETVAQTGIR
jgi:hypothetical protein